MPLLAGGNFRAAVNEVTGTKLEILISDGCVVEACPAPADQPPCLAVGFGKADFHQRRYHAEAFRLACVNGLLRQALADTAAGKGLLRCLHRRRRRSAPWHSVVVSLARMILASLISAPSRALSRLTSSIGSSVKKRR